MGRTSTIDRFAGVVALLTKAPRTQTELSRLLGVPLKNGVYKHLEALKEEGLIYIHDWANASGNYIAVYAWQPTGREVPDAVRPE